jgi:hypothetical protein
VESKYKFLVGYCKLKYRLNEAGEDEDIYSGVWISRREKERRHRIMMGNSGTQHLIMTRWFQSSIPDSETGLHPWSFSSRESSRWLELQRFYGCMCWSSCNQKMTTGFSGNVRHVMKQFRKNDGHPSKTSWSSNEAYWLPTATTWCDLMVRIFIMTEGTRQPRKCQERAH